jgi:hypothetical protein
MDPLSISASCLTLLCAVTKTSKAITAFVKAFREARTDLLEVTRELSDLKDVLDLLKIDSEIKDGERLLPNHLQEQILAIIDKCGDVLIKINAALDKHKGHVGDVRWIVTGKNDVAHLRLSLEAYRNALSLAVDTVTLYVSTRFQ